MLSKELTRPKSKRYNIIYTTQVFIGQIDVIKLREEKRFFFHFVSFFHILCAIIKSFTKRTLMNKSAWHSQRTENYCYMNTHTFDVR